ncbi:MAG: UvrD-helicase domain-containing protein [Alphaproteobacteria bacterium]
MNGQTATPLDLAGISLSGHNAIDASAGTGKTYAISRLYLRLVLEREGSGDQIVDRTLVVTFTKAATAELRRRIRDTLVEARTVLSRRLDAREKAVVEGAGVDAVLAKVRADDLPDAIRRLDQAVAGFDRAAIFTIHSFCQRALSESAFESGRLFDCELEADDRAALGEVVDDFWRKRVATVDRDFAEYLRAKSVLRDPASLLKQLRRHVGMRGLKVLPERPPDLGPLRRAARESWEESAREAFRLFEKEAVIDGTDVGVPGRCVLKMTSFTEPTRKKILEAIDRMVLGSEVDLDFVKNLKKLDRKDVLERVKEGSLPALPFFDHCSNLVRQAELVADPFRFQEIELRTDALRWANAEVQRRRDRRAVQIYSSFHIEDCA